MFDPGQSKSCGYATKLTRFTPAVNGGILSLLKDSTCERPSHPDAVGRNRLDRRTAV